MDEYLTEFRKLKKEIQKVEKKKTEHWIKLDKKYLGTNHNEKRGNYFKDPLYESYRLTDNKCQWLRKVKTEMLYERYFFKHSKGEGYISGAKSRNGEFLDDKCFRDIRNILSKWYNRVMSNVNYFHLLYEGATENSIDPKETGGISVSTWDFIGDLVYKIIREIAEPKLYFYQDSQQYSGVLFRNLWEWRKLKGLFSARP